MAGNYQTAEERKKQKISGTGTTKQSSGKETKKQGGGIVFSLNPSGQYQTAEEWKEQRDQQKLQDYDSMYQKIKGLQKWGQDADSFYSAWHSQEERDKFLAGMDMDSLDHMLTNWKQKYGGEDIQGIEDYLSRFRSGVKQYEDFYSQFADEETYNAYKQIAGWYQKYQGKSASELGETVERLEDGKEKEWLTQYARSVYQEEMGLTDLEMAQELVAQKKQDIKDYNRDFLRHGNPDYQTQDNPYGNGAGFGGDNAAQNAGFAIAELYRSYMDGRKGKQQALNEAQQELDQIIYAGDMLEISQMSPEEKSALELYKARKDAAWANRVTGMSDSTDKDVLKVLEAFGGRYDIRQIDALAETYGRAQNEQLMKDVEAMAVNQGQGDFWTKVGASAATVPVNFVGQSASFFSHMMDLANGTGRYSGFDENTVGNVFGTYSDNVRGTVAEGIRGDGDSFWRNAAAWGYQIGMDSVDSIVNGLLPNSAALVFSATDTFGQTLTDAAERGASYGDALMLAVANTAIEVGAEKIPLDKLADEMLRDPNGTMGMVKSVLKGMGVELTKEEFKLTASLLADVAIMQDNSEFSSQIAAEMLAGKSYEEAQTAASKKILQDVLNTAITSLISGGVSGVREGVNESRKNKQESNAQQGSNTQQGPDAQPGPNTQQGPDVLQGPDAQLGADVQQGLNTQQGPDTQLGSDVQQGPNAPQDSDAQPGEVHGEADRTTDGRTLEESKQLMDEYTKFESEKRADEIAKKLRYEKEFRELQESLGKNAPKSLDEFLYLKYSSGKWEQFQSYRKSIETGKLSAMANFDLYRKTSSDIDSSLVGVTTSNGIQIKSKSDSFIARVIGSVEERRSGVDIEDIIAALTDPNTKVYPVKTTASGKVSQKFRSRSVVVTVDPQTGNLIKANYRGK